MADFVIELEGRQFRRGYLLYVIEIRHGIASYYYVGQTGDRNYITARPAFRRLSGHFEDRESSTQNQIYKFLVKILGNGESVGTKKYDERTKLEVEDFLAASRVFMHAYEVIVFKPDVALEDHRRNVRRLEELERKVIKAFVDCGKQVINKSLVGSDVKNPFPEILSRIKSDFGLR